jgi:imidazolonepropionase-like amidohydrolase
VTDWVMTHVQIIDGTGAAPYPGEVLISGGQIAAVSPPGEQVARDGAAVVDGHGQWLMPGLVEPHGHLTFPDAATRTDFEKLPPEEHTLATMHNARKMLDAGYTSCLSAASAKARLDVVVRNEILAGRIPGPRLLANGPEITVTGGLGDINQMHLPYQPEPAFSMVVDGADEMRKVCRRLVREGVDLLKLNLSGDLGQPRARSEETVMNDAEVTACVEVANSRGLRVCAHARSADSIRLALRHGIRILYHGTYPDEDALERLQEVRNEVFVVPTLGHLHASCHRAAAWGLTPERAKERGLVRELEHGVAAAKAMRARGIRILPGGDYGFAWTPHGTYARDVELFVTLLGYTPMEALLAATRDAGEIMAPAYRVGQVRPGYAADLLLVQGNPLQDIAILQQPERLLMIVKDGQFHKALPAAAAIPRSGIA